MFWFKRKKKIEPMIVVPPPTSRVEIEVHKGATEKAAQKAQDVNRHLNDLLVENGITIKIALAAGAQLKQRKQGGKY